MKNLPADKDYKPDEDILRQSGKLKKSKIK